VTDHLLRDLRQLQQYAAGLRGLLTDADAQAPQQAVGTDRTGTVSVVLGPDGLPNSVRVTSDWRPRRQSAGAWSGAMVAGRG
jgi:hypothetical protein